jgi:hypothetical protein
MVVVREKHPKEKPPKENIVKLNDKSQYVYDV